MTPSTPQAMRIPRAPAEPEGPSVGDVSGRVRTLTRAGAVLILGPVLVRATSEYAALPYWDPIPPTSLHIDGLAAPLGALTASGSMLLDALILIGCVVVFGAMGLARVRPSRVSLALLVPGLVAVGLHGWVLAGGTIGDRVLGLAWGAGFVGAVALAHACALDRALRRVVVGVLLAFPAMLVIKGAHQVYVEHADVVRDFVQHREERLAQRGLAPGSPGAKALERRLLQADPTGWFALSNVFASYVGAALVPLLLLGAQRGASKAGRVAALLLGLACLGMLVVSGSKGALGALLVGGAATGALMLARSGRLAGLPGRARSALPTLVVLGVVGIPLLAVLVRGLVGERIGELSLLFRAFYTRTAAHIFLDHPLLGVGPDGFKTAYTLAKPMVSPEEVASPHSLFFDWGATLGVLGLAWGVLWVLSLVRLARGAAEPAVAGERATAPEALERDAETKLTMLIVALATIGALFAARDAILPETAGVRLVGALAWGGVAIWLLPLLRDGRRLVLAASAGVLVLGAHAQIEVTPTFLGSSALFLLVTCAGGAGVIRPSGARSPLAPVAALACAGLSVGVVALGVAPARAWEGRLHEGASLGARASHLADRLVVMTDGRTPPGERQRLLGELAGDPAIAPASSAQDVVRRGALAISALTDRAGTLLATGATASDWRTVREASGLELWCGATLARLGASREAVTHHLDLALAHAEAGAKAAPAQGPAIQNVGAIRMARAELLGLDADRVGAAEAYERVLELDPTNAPAAITAMGLWSELGETERAAGLARTALRIDEAMRLDPEVRGLTPDQRAMAERLSGP